MKISIHTDSQAEETEIQITCRHLTPQLEKVISILRILDFKILGQKDGESHVLDISKILYIDTADKKTFLYTKDDVFESCLKLYELEEELKEFDFFRAGKSCIINLRQIQAIRADLDRKLRVTMTNGEQLTVSRQYADYVRKKLGVK